MQTLDQKTISPVTSDTFTFDLPTLTRTLLLHRRMILGVSVGTGLIFFALSFLLRNTYKAVAVVMPPDRTSSFPAMLGAMASASGLSSGGAGAMGALNLKSPADLYVALMSGRGVEDAVVKRFDLQSVYKIKLLSKARKQFESNAEIEADAKSGLISISVKDHDPDRAARIANGIIEAFDQSSSHLAITDAQRRRIFFEQQLAQTKENLTRAEEDLKDTVNRTGLVQPEEDAKSLIGFEADLRAQIASKTVELESMKVYLSDENPQVLTARRELEGLQSQAAALSQKTGGGDSDFPSKGAQSSASLDYLRKLRELRFNESLFDLLGKNLEAAKLDEAREGITVQVVDYATPPDTKDGPHRSLFLVGGFAIGLLLSSLWAVLRWNTLPGPSSAPTAGLRNLNL